MTKILDLPTHGSKAGEHKKTIGTVVIAIFVVLLALGAFTLLGSNTKKDNSMPAGVPPVTEEGNKVLPVDTDNKDETSQSEDPVFVPASECPEGMILNEEIGECEPSDKVPDEVGPVGEPTGYENVKGYLSYINHYHKYYEENRISEEKLDDLDTVSTHMRVNGIKKGVHLNFSTGHFLNGNFIVNKVFTSNKVDRILVGDGNTSYYAYTYSGCFTKLNDPNYKYCALNNAVGSIGAITVIENSPYDGFGIEGTIFVHEGKERYKTTSKVKGFRAYIDYKPGFFVY